MDCWAAAKAEDSKVTRRSGNERQGNVRQKQSFVS